jgi:hypothetical protein
MAQLLTFPSQCKSGGYGSSSLLRKQTKKYTLVTSIWVIVSAKKLWEVAVKALPAIAPHRGLAG